MKQMYLDKLEYIQAADASGHMYHEMLNSMESEVQYFFGSFRDDYTHLSGWGHQYFCHEDGGKLIFDMENPHEHKCEICGRVYTGEKYDNIWTYFYRNEAALAIWKCAAIFKIRKDAKYLRILESILGFYAENYTRFTIHVKDKVNVDINLDVGGAGRLMPQGLNEAIVITRIINALEMVKEDLEPVFMQMVKERFLKEAAALLKPQVNQIHNIPTWKNCALGIIGFFCRDQELLDFVFNSEFGIENQLKKGVTPDGFWYEGSIHYNFFVLEGLTNLLLFTKLYGYDFATGREYAHRMLNAAYHYAFDNHILPNPNDGWPNINLKTYSYIYQIAVRYFGQESEIGNLMKNIENGKVDRAYLPLSKPYFYKEICLEHLLLNPDFTREGYVKTHTASISFPTSYFGMLRVGEVNVFCKYGLRGPSHAHPDIMNIEVMIGNHSLSRDLSNCGYAARLCNEWHRMTASHNTVAVDCQNQTSRNGGEVLIFDEKCMHVKATEVYGGVDFIRKVEITGDSIRDEFEVYSSQEHRYDYFFHSEGSLETILELEPYQFEDLQNGYQHLQEARKVITDQDQIALQWRLDGRCMTSTIDIRGKELILAKTYDNPVTGFRNTFIVRNKSCKDIFSVLWQISK